MHPLLWRLEIQHHWSDSSGRCGWRCSNWKLMSHPQRREREEWNSVVYNLWPCCICWQWQEQCYCWRCLRSLGRCQQKVQQQEQQHSQFLIGTVGIGIATLAHSTLWLCSSFWVRVQLCTPFVGVFATFSEELFISVEYTSGASIGKPDKDMHRCSSIAISFKTFNKHLETLRKK